MKAIMLTYFIAEKRKVDPFIEEVNQLINVIAYTVDQHYIYIGVEIKGFNLPIEKIKTMISKKFRIYRITEIKELK